jgi:hypothetical protein
MTEAEGKSVSMVRVTVMLQPDQYDELFQYVREIGSTMSAFFRESAVKAMREGPSTEDGAVSGRDLRGTNPSQAAKSRPLENTSPAPIAATVAIEMIGPIPSTVIRRTHAGSRSTKFVISADKPSIRSSSRRLVTGQILDDGASCAARARQSIWQGCLAIRCAESAAPGATATPRSNRKSVGRSDTVVDSL